MVLPSIARRVACLFTKPADISLHLELSKVTGDSGTRSVDLCPIHRCKSLKVVDGPFGSVVCRLTERGGGKPFLLDYFLIDDTPGLKVPHHELTT